MKTLNRTKSYAAQNPAVLRTKAYGAPLGAVRSVRKRDGSQKLGRKCETNQNKLENKPMPLLYIKRYTRKMIQAHPDWLFVFGDNLARTGYGGQAKEARDEPNAVGVATKRKPTMNADAFLCDGDYEEWSAANNPAIGRLWRHGVEGGGVIVWPLDGIGTDLARLKQSAPALCDCLEDWRLRLEEEANQ